MKYIFLILLATINLFALNIYLNSAKEGGLPYAVLHIIDTEPIECKIIPLALDKKNYICKFNKILKTKLNEKKLRLVNIDFLEKKNKFYIKIIPAFGSKLIASNESLYNTKEVKSEQFSKKSRRWIVLLYEKPPFGTKKDNEGINFPITYNNYLKPYIGPVDLNGAPIAYAKSQDINYYLDIQKEFADKDYDSVVKDVDRVLRQYPNSIFKSDLLLYKLKSIDTSIEKNISPVSDKYTNNDVSKLAKSWMREFSSNENISQVLLILVKNYIRAQSSPDVNYFLDIMVTEHKNSQYTKRAILYFADSLYNKNDKKRAMKLYEDVLFSSKNLDIASLAAIRLANSKINSGKIFEAKKYLLKVLNANKKYLLKDKDATTNLAVKLAANGLENIAAQINDLLLQNLNKGEIDTKELLLKQSGDWYAKAGKVKKAYKRYLQYKKEYKNGIYINEVNKAIDRLFFEIKETNTTKLAKYYDVLISKYNNDIKDKAILEKAKLFLKQKKYVKIINMKNMLLKSQDKNSTAAQDIIKEAAIVLIKKNIKENNCQIAVKLFQSNSVKFNEIGMPRFLFKCLMLTAKYKRASDLAMMKLSTKELKEKFIWLENSILAYSKLQKFTSIINLKNDLVKLSKIIKQPISAAVYRSLFDAYYFNKSYGKSINALQKLSKYWPNDIKNIEPYYKIINYASDTRDDLLLMTYAKKILFLQKKYKINSYSPRVNFLYIEALKRMSMLKKAKDITKNLLKLNLNDSDKSRALYELGELSIKLKDTKLAKNYFLKCSQIKIDNSWKTLCKENLNLL